MVKSIEVPSSSTLRDLHLSAKSYIKFSNNISSINVVSALQESSVSRRNLTKFTAGSNVRALSPSCFISCQNLTSVSFKGEVDTIGKYAFYGCSSLADVSILSSGQVAQSIGDYAFARTGIQKAKFRAKNSSSEYALLGEGIFASCYSLRDFSFADETVAVDHMLADCSALTSVSFAKKTVSLAPNALENCTSLYSIRMAADTYAVPPEFAKGCTSLQSFTFAEPGELVYDQSLGDRMLDGTPLTSLTFPSSLTSFDVFSQSTLEGMDDLREIHFNGMTYSQIASSVTTQQQVNNTKVLSYYTDKVYYESSLANMVALGTTSSNKSMFIKKSQADICTMFQKCFNNHIPFVVFMSGDSLACSHCAYFAKKGIKSSSFINFVKNNKSCIIFYVYHAISADCKLKFKNTTYGDLWSLFGNPGIGYVALFECWNKSNGTLVRQFFTSQINGKIDEVKNAVSKITSFSKGYTAPGSSSSTELTSTTVNPTIVGTNCFGLGHDVKLFGNDNKSVNFIANAGGSSGAIMYSQQTIVDNITTDSFRYGQWYGKARDLKLYADSNYIPVLAVASQGSSFRQSAAFNSIFNDPSFQEQMQSKRILLCKVDSSSFSAGDASFLVNQWMGKGSFQHFPLLMMYWTKKDGTMSIEDGETFDAVLDDFAYFSTNDADEKIDDVECVHDSSEIFAWIDGLTVYKQYVPQDRFDKPEISSYLSRYPKYKCYANQIDDDYGRYYPTVTQSPALESSYEVNVNNSSNKATKYTLSFSAGPAQLPPEGTYQYFSMLSNSINQAVYDSSYQVSGLMFKVGKTIESQVVTSSTFDYHVETEQQYLDSIGITDDKVSNVESSFYDELYLTDENDDPTTSLDPSVTSAMEFLWNVKKTVTLKPGTTVDTKPAEYVVMLLSSQASTEIVHVVDDDGDDSYIKVLVPGSPQYTIDAKVIGESTGSNQLLWIKEFNNQ